MEKNDFTALYNTDLKYFYKRDKFKIADRSIINQAFISKDLEFINNFLRLHFSQRAFKFNSEIFLLSKYAKTIFDNKIIDFLLQLKLHILNENNKKSIINYNKNFKEENLNKFFFSKIIELTTKNNITNNFKITQQAQQLSDYENSFLKNLINKKTLINNFTGKKITNTPIALKLNKFKYRLKKKKY